MTTILPSEVYFDAPDVMRYRPSEEAYEWLREKHVKRIALLAQRCLHRLPTALEFQDLIYSESLRALIQVSADINVEDDVLAKYLLHRMPANEQAIHAISGNNVTVEQISEIPGKIVDYNDTAFASIVLPRNTVPNLYKQLRK